VSPIQVHSVVEGARSGPTVVLVNSLGATSRMWDPQVPTLAAGRRVVRYDARGHGRSPVPPGPYTIEQLADDLLALLDRLDVERAHLVGLSLGGMTAMSLAAERPDRVVSLSLLCTSARLGPEQMWLDRAHTARTQGMAVLGTTVIERWFTPRFRAEHADQVAAMQKMLESTPAEGYAAACDAIQHLDLRERLPSITAPTLVVAGSEDPVAPPEHARLIADSIPGSRLEVIDGAAHLANIEEPARVTDLLVEHITEAEEADHA
jgi:3-oxoadipate enol-lactonase